MNNKLEYVNDLSLDEQLIFLRRIIRLIGKDGRIDDAERSFMKELAREYQIPREYSAQINQQISEENLLKEAQKLDRKKSLYLIKELLTVANSDEDLDDSEIDFVIKVSNFLNLEDEKVAELNQLVLDEMSLSERCYQALELG